MPHTAQEPHVAEKSLQIVNSGGGGGQNRQPVVLAPQPTGRRIVTFQGGTSRSDMAKMLGEATGSEAVLAAEAGSLSAALRASGASGAPLVLDRFPIAVIGGNLQQAASAANMLLGHDEVVDARPEFWMFAVEGPPWGDSVDSTWGVEATGAAASRYDGSGIKIAILDTGIDLGHPDFAGRTIVTETFVGGPDAADVRGHGTHCAGTAASGHSGGGNLPRYGVAPRADLYVGKVLSDSGAGREVDIIAGIEWALGHGCEVISMSLTRPTAPGEAADPMYEDIAKRALAAGSLIVAAAGNESDRRFNYVAPVGAPANSPSVLAVAAIGSDGGIASFSCGGSGTSAVDLCAPGLAILSSVPRPQLYKKLQGTSMACPHVAGIAALWAQANPALRGQALWDALVAAARPVGGLGPTDVGAGLVTAP
jgi:subtilisin family serine protease